MLKTYEDRLYQTHCSEKTLQSDQKGFFLDIIKHVTDAVGEKSIKQKFSNLKNDQDRIKILYSCKPLFTAFSSIVCHVQEVYRKKSSTVAQARRNDGEKALKEGKFEQALTLFSQSVLKSELTDENSNVDDGKTLSLALFKRACVLFSLDRYEIANVDFHLSLKEKLPEEFKVAAYSKMAIAYKKLGDIKKSEICFNLAKKCINDEKVLQNFTNTLEKSSFIVKNKIDKKEVPSFNGKTNTKFPNASENIDVNKSLEFGRHVVAKHHIKTGETLVIEPPYAACLLPEMFGAYCHHCFKRLLNPIGCSVCSGVAFCSTDCKNTASSTYHKYECKFLDLMIGSGVSILSHVALRMITQFSLEECLQKYKDRDKEPIFSLCTNSNLRSSMDFFQRTLMAGFLLRILQISGYFGKDDKDAMTINDQECIVGELILFYLQILQFNAHEIYETIYSKKSKNNFGKMVYIGVGIYPTAAFFNHHCSPGVTRYFVGKDIVIKSIKPLIPNEIIFENYGPNFAKKSLTERKKNLGARYWFDCACTACVQNWPQIMNADKEYSEQIRCPRKCCNNTFTLPLANMEVHCPVCKNVVNLSENESILKECNENYWKGIKNLDNKLETVKILSSAIDKFHKVSTHPHKLTYLAQEALKTCYLNMGNTFTITD